MPKNKRTVARKSTKVKKSLGKKVAKRATSAIAKRRAREKALLRSL